VLIYEPLSYAQKRVDPSVKAAAKPRVSFFTFEGLVAIEFGLFWQWRSAHQGTTIVHSEQPSLRIGLRLAWLM
jgi:hypothetical protein